MPNPSPIDEPKTLEDTIDQLLLEMSYVSCDSDEYAKMADQLQKLYLLKEVDSKKRISSDTWATIAAHLGGIVLIVGHERANVVTSKAIGFVKKLW